MYIAIESEPRRIRASQNKTQMHKQFYLTTRSAKACACVSRLIEMTQKSEQTKNDSHQTQAQNDTNKCDTNTLTSSSLLVFAFGWLRQKTSFLLTDDAVDAAAAVANVVEAF